MPYHLHKANNTQKVTGESVDEQGTNNCERVKTYLALHPDAKVREVAGALMISVSTADKDAIPNFGSPAEMVLSNMNDAHGT